MKNLLKNPLAWLGSIIVVLLVVIAAQAARGNSPAPAAEAALPPEATVIVDSLKRDIDEYAEGDELETRGRTMKARASAAAKGKDLTLCAEYQVRYDRATKTTVSDANCPLL